jgi:uncharacterized protein YjbI with pentapeptide repeats
VNLHEAHVARSSFVGADLTDAELDAEELRGARAFDLVGCRS